MNMRQPNQLSALLYALQAQQQAPQNMLAGLEEDFDPNSIVGRMLAAQRAQAAAQAAQAATRAPRPAPAPTGPQSATSVLERRMREAGVRQ